MIQVTKKWFIDSDGQQYILFRRENYYSEKLKEEKVRQADVSYHSTVSSALTQLIRKMHKKKVKNNDMTLREALNEFNKIESIIVKSVQGKEI